MGKNPLKKVVKVVHKPLKVVGKVVENLVNQVGKVITPAVLTNAKHISQDVEAMLPGAEKLLNGLNATLGANSGNIA